MGLVLDDDRVNGFVGYHDDFARREDVRRAVRELAIDANWELLRDKTIVRPSHNVSYKRGDEIDYLDERKRWCGPGRIIGEIPSN